VVPDGTGGQAEEEEPRQRPPARPRLGGWKASLWAAGAALLLAATLAAVWLVRRPGAPHHFRMEGTRLVVLDSRDRVCWTRQFPAFGPDYDTFVRDKVLIADIDGDGRPEVLFSFHPETPGAQGDTLTCFDAAGNTRWEFRYGARKSFAGRSFDPSFAGRFVRLVNGAGKRYILTVANHCLWYPAQAALLDPATGRLVEEYWHPGSIYHLALEDLDGDGQNEILLGAINNPGDGLGHAAMAVLKIPFSSAPRRSPEPGDPFPPPTGGGELAYLLFPLPDVNRVMGRLPIMGRFLVDQNRRILVQTPLADEGGIVYYLDFNLNLLEYRFSDNFAALHERYYRQHLLDHQLSPAESAALGKLARFPAAPDGNSPDLQKIWRY
jgi:hypothetical protein